MGIKSFMGTGTALVTPFGENGVDYGAFGRLIDTQISGGVDFLVVLGTTGEAPTVTAGERRELISFALDRAAGRLPIVIGTGGNDTQHAKESCLEAKSLGADGALVVTPYYNKPTQEGLFRHFETIARVSDFPVIAYNVPGRTGVNMTAETTVRLAGIDNIVGVKEAGSLDQADEIIRSLRGSRPDFAILSGNDDMAFHMVNSGGHGVISVLSNIAPREVADLVSLARGGQVQSARELHLLLLPLMKSIFTETNPIPVKYALSRMGICRNILRLPLTEASPACAARVERDMERCGLCARVPA